MSVIALIPAAGAGQRMGSTINKQYLCLNGQPVLTHTIALFDTHPSVDHIYVIAPPEQIALCRQQCIEPYNFTKVRDIIGGGCQRQDSVRNGIANCGAEDGDIIIIHDGVRPLFAVQQLDALIAQARMSGACVVGVPVKDTIKQVHNGQISATPARETLWAAHTPQVFRYELIYPTHLRAQQHDYHGTDDASLLEWQGIKVSMLEGSYRNIKITTPEDMLIAAAFISADSNNNTSQV
ncbi:MAG: 2-C-methyl-D-erythritol 4-phosphate cytidylyltransferase [Desulfobacteraceae bacterium 4572_35.1]|nr:MAG: 2-C-methyl-D-erythritol 4-phosphate cytidylyltransferase [Desulfobacteraceae bacterium 4572_35.1]